MGETGDIKGLSAEYAGFLIDSWEDIFLLKPKYELPLGDMVGKRAKSAFHQRETKNRHGRRQAKHNRPMAYGRQNKGRGQKMRSGHNSRIHHPDAHTSDTHA